MPETKKNTNSYTQTSPRHYNKDETDINWSGLHESFISPPSSQSIINNAGTQKDVMPHPYLVFTLPLSRHLGTTSCQVRLVLFASGASKWSLKKWRMGLIVHRDIVACGFIPPADGI
ncbi:unnamed protein product [Periconia digitata]|uniref:Uncharacterized protein n=1 Tax=Periconia digitata TaxID=1303443 RepID=A0A9W4UNS0_9PLEO|nr:unnamed protein product [Periconia digitata]